jgi:hypothetical protein
MFFLRLRPYHEQPHSAMSTGPAEGHVHE